MVCGPFYPQELYDFDHRMGHTLRPAQTARTRGSGSERLVRSKGRREQLHLHRLRGRRHYAKKRAISFSSISASPDPCVTSKIVLIGRWHQPPVHSFHDLKTFFAKPLGHLLIVMSVGIKRSEAIASCM